MLRYVPIAIGLVLIIWLGIVQGIWSDRWTDPSVGARESADRLEHVPTEVGNWKVVRDDTESTDPRVLETAGAVGHVSRTYQNAKTGQTVSIYLICGHSRSVCSHTPDICYPASGFTAVNTQFKYPVKWNDVSSDFNTKSFRKESIDGVQILRIFWAWAIDPIWQAPDSPQREYPRVRALYKMYLITPEGRGGEPADSVCLDFAKVFIPELNKVLFPPEPAPGEDPANPSA